MSKPLVDTIDKVLDDLIFAQLAVAVADGLLLLLRIGCCSGSGYCYCGWVAVAVVDWLLLRIGCCCGLVAVAVDVAVADRLLLLWLLLWLWLLRIG